MSEQEAKKLLDTVENLTQTVEYLTAENKRLKQKLERMNELLLNIRFLGQNPPNAELEQFLPWSENIQAECKPRLP